MLSPLTHDDPAGFGSYRLIARLGSGGMGTVYLARSAGGRTVALKTMHAGIASDPGFRTRFRLETDAARIIGGHHGAIVVDADPVAQTPWLATEYVLGPPLDDAVSLAGPLPEPSVRALGAALAGALAQLHASEVVHRDLKPSNVMVTAYGPKIIDFGIARAAGDDRLTRTGAAAGTPAFMSPEQATGQEHTPPGDVFALAGVLVFAATGHGPFGTGQPADLLYRVRYADPDLTGVPDALNATLTRCLSKDPAQRPTTTQLATELHNGQGQFADHLPDTLLAEIARRATEVWRHQPYRLPAPTDHATAESFPASTHSPMSRRKVLALSGGSALAVTAIGVGAWSRLGKEEPRGKGAPKNLGISAPYPKNPDEDHLWKVKVSSPPGDLWPAAASVPFPVGDLLALIVSSGLAAVNPRTGQTSWTTGELEHYWQVTSDGEEIYRIGHVTQSDAKNDRSSPLSIETVNLTNGRLKKRLPQLKDFNGAILENQLVCASEGVVYLAAGQGADSKDGIERVQPWFLAAVDTGTGKELWRQPLPVRPEGSKRLHFLIGRVVGDRLVLLQETAEGAVRVVARNARSGKVLWDVPMVGAKPDQARGPLAIDSTHVYLGLGPLRALRLADGGEAWNYVKKSGKFGREFRYFGPPAVTNGVVYAVQEKLGLIGLDAKDGGIEWLDKGVEGSDDLTGPPVIGTEYAYSKRHSGLCSVSLASGTTSRTYKTSGTRFVAHERGRVLIALGGHFLAAFPLQ
ncbi:protein kinase domain-containing protein [Streptomyces sp. NBC_01794]|uniref:serine/threonine-protein kinase n=1 Tax=Streptomyces sp. NBC_01794 TaxID=2975942 RepID=UPI0030881FB5|nr:serine/threonine-protein kinase [Streptomyces sp. NBC_01794]